MKDNHIFNIDINLIDGTPLNWKRFDGKKLLIVNVASECGFTPQYAQLQELSEQYKDQLVVLGVPCNDFGAQEPGSLEEISLFCRNTYKVDFPMTEKIGILNDTHPLYQYLTKAEVNGDKNHDVKWNFHKFLLSEKGEVLASFPSQIIPFDDEVLSYLK